MKHRILTQQDLTTYNSDILKCYHDNKLIFDDCTPEFIKRDVVGFLGNFIEAEDSYVVGIFSDNDAYLLGIVIYDNNRCLGSEFSAQVHIAFSKGMWGRVSRDVCTSLIQTGLPTMLYCEVPVIAVRVIGLLKALGFKKTGYIPKALPYTNSKGEKKMYDLNIFVKERTNAR